MKRSAIIIGVDRTGGMPTLKDAAKGARRFQKWAIDQKFDTPQVFTDEDGAAVNVWAIKTAIKEIVNAGTTEQLLIYFAGHGVNIGYGEYWLLSDAPGDPQAAVNVRSSAWQAAYSGIPHTIFISDACRTAAEGAAAQRVTGSELFPNDGAGGLEKPVDIFYACTLGRPALEVRDPMVAASVFSALYTGAFLDGLLGKHPELLEWRTEAGQSVAYVRPKPLKPHLSAEVPRRLVQLKLQATAIQEPDAHITSDGTEWIARLTEDGSFVSPAQTGVRRGRMRRAVTTPAALLPTAEAASSLLLQSVLRGGMGALTAASENREPEERRRSRGTQPLISKATEIVDPGSALTTLAQKTAIPFGPSHHETECGFKIRGAKISAAISHGAVTELVGPPGEIVRIDNVPTPGASVLLVLENGTGMLLPAIRGFLAALTMEDGELVDVAYEPSDNTPRWQDFQHRAADLRALRAVAASATRSGVFRLEGDNALEVARRMQYLKGVDPSLAIYAAYAYHDLQRRDLIQRMSGYMREDLGGRLFDVALLAGELHNVTIRASKEQGLLSPVPLLVQGWSLLAAQAITLPRSLTGIQSSLLPSVWTLFDEEGVMRIEAAIKQHEIL